MTLFNPKLEKVFKEGDPGYAEFLDQQRKKLEKEIKELERQVQEDEPII